LKAQKNGLAFKLGRTEAGKREFEAVIFPLYLAKKIYWKVVSRLEFFNVGKKAGFLPYNVDVNHLMVLERPPLRSHRRRILCTPGVLRIAQRKRER
jgi:hypothetical protein